MIALELIGREGVENLWAGRLRLAIQQLQAACKQRGAAESIVTELLGAQAELDADISLLPQDADSRIRRGICRIALAVLQGDGAGSCAGAIADLTVAVALRPEDPRNRLHLANALIVRVRFGVATEQVGTIESAMSDLDMAVKLEGPSAPVCHSRAMAGLLKARLLRMGGWDAEPCIRQAIADLTQASELEPANSQVHKDLGVAKMMLASRIGSRAIWREALSHFDMACRGGGAIAGVLYKRGQVHFALRNFAQAWADFVRCMELDPALGRRASEWISRTCAIVG